MSAADFARAGPEAVLAATSLGAAFSLGPRAARPIGAALILAFGLLALAAAAGAAQYAGLGGAVLTQAHAALTAVFGSLGFAAALGATLLAAAPLRRAGGRWGVLAVVTAAGVVLARFAPLAPLVALAQLVAAALRPGRRRTGFVLAGVALIAVVASQLLLAPGVVRLGALHLLLAGWTAALAFAGRSAAGAEGRAA